MAENPFDQFDTPETEPEHANPFDRFDSIDTDEGNTGDPFAFRRMSEGEKFKAHVNNMLPWLSLGGDVLKSYQYLPGVRSIMRGFGQALSQDYEEKLGLSDESRAFLAKHHILPESIDDYRHPLNAFKSFNESIILPLAVGLDAIWRLPTALYHGAQEAGIEAGLHRDIVSIPDAFMGSPGALPHYGRQGVSTAGDVMRADTAPGSISALYLGPRLGAPRPLK